ncbi:MAG: valine--tRNA ligase, partial [bacterium]|nr:valine--tRNA ligase [bacterium]
RYKHLIGKNVILPIINKLIPIIGDIHADPEFGTGVVKITPAHDPNDFEVGNRHNLERIVVMNPDATMNDKAGKYEGMSREKCREELIKDLEKEELLISIEEMIHSVGHSERTDAPVEPYLSKQWFVKMETLAKNTLNNQKNKDSKVNFIPKRFEKILNHWMEDCHDWCISRQLWWGHRIPAWYKDDEVYVGVDAPDGDGWIQDNDVLDTWFSSALWPFSTLGWPEKTEDLDRYFPTDVLVTGYDIIFFWVCRMVFQSLEFMNERPFKDCLIHGLIRDKEGRKMSKSLGNGVDPMDVIDEYGCDALRFFLATSSAPGQDLRYDEEKVKSTWNFINKLWNASRYVLMSLEDYNESDYSLKNLSISDKWILTRLNETIKTVRKNMEKYEFNNVGSELYTFIWDDFCSWYIELSKVNMNNTTKSVLIKVLTDILKMLHPIMPYVTEEIYSMLPIKESNSIMISTYPRYEKELVFINEKNLLKSIMNDIVSIRNLKANNNIPKDALVKINVDDDIKNIYYSQLKIKNEQVIFNSEEGLLSVGYSSNNLKIEYFYKGEEKDLEKTFGEINKLKSSIERREKLLSNDNYVNKAPKNIVDIDKQKLKEEKEKLEQLLKEI